MRKEDSWYHIGAGGITSKESNRILNETMNKFKHNKELKRAKKNLKKVGKIFADECRKSIYSYTTIPDLSFSDMVDRSCRCQITIEELASCLDTFKVKSVHNRLDLMTLEFNSQLNKINQITMHEKLIKQIKELPGVKIVHRNIDSVIVEFEPVEQAVECENVEQWDFMWMQIRGAIKHASFNYVSSVSNEICNCVTLNGGFTSRNGGLKDNYTILPFSQYLTDYNLRDEFLQFMTSEAEKRGYFKFKHKWGDESRPICKKLEYNPDWGSDQSCLYDTETKHVIWNNSGKWAEIIPDEVELVEGEVYHYKTRDEKYIFRNGFSVLEQSNSFKCIDVVVLNHRDISPATPTQTAKLIRAEIKNGYLWNGKELISLKKK